MLQIEAKNIVKTVMDKHGIKNGTQIKIEQLQEAIAESICSVITSREYIKFLGEAFEQERRRAGMAIGHKI